jgi:hypothetical protein
VRGTTSWNWLRALPEDDSLGHPQESINERLSQPRWQQRRAYAAKSFRGMYPKLQLWIGLIPSSYGNLSFGRR